MNNQLSVTSNIKPLQLHAEDAVIIEEQVTVNIEQRLGEKEEHAEAVRKYENDLKKFEIAIQDFRKELLDVFHKSQETFEKQLSYIAAGALSLSIGFIQEIVKPIKTSHNKWMLILGWGALIFTLLINLISHFIAGWHAKQGAKEAANFEKYDENKINRRGRWITGMNIATVATLTGGILLIVWYIVINAIL